MLMCAALTLTLAGPVAAQEQENSSQQAAAVQEREALERARAQEREKEERARSQEKEKQEKERQETVATRRAILQGQAINVRLELTIRDQRGSGQPVTKTISMVAADRTMGRIRTGSTVFTERHGPQPVLVNVDGRPTVLSDGRVLLQLTLEYRPADPVAPRPEGAPAPPAQAQAPPHVSETIETIVENGKPLVISRSADPDSDRSVTVEVKATILK
jgi:hypothetical protein